MHNIIITVYYNLLSRLKLNSMEQERWQCVQAYEAPPFLWPFAALLPNLAGGREIAPAAGKLPAPPL